MSDARIGLGVGLDLPWSGPYGIDGDAVSDRTMRFFERYADRFASVFVSWQPRDKGRPDAASVIPIFDAFFEAVPIATRGLHQTALNLAGADYDRGPVIAMTNALIERYGFQWVNEDLGSWSVRGRPLPYPQPPPLTAEGIAHCIRTCAEVDAALDAPLVVEFPGFETPAPWQHGTLDAYDVFRAIVHGAGVRCTLDTGHLLTWRWLAGHRGEALLEGLERLPLSHCHELHCAGTYQKGDAMVDAHHGVLLDLQLELASRLMERCPNLRVVTYEDPRFDAFGRLPPPAERSLDALATRVDAWMQRPAQPHPLEPRSPLPAAPATPWEDGLRDAFDADDAFGRRCRQQILTREARGVGAPRTLYAEALSRFPDTDAALTAFLASDDGKAWSDMAWAVPGRCIEDALGRFLARGSAAHLQACAKVLATHPDPPFTIPDGFRRAPGGWFAVADTHLYAAVDGKLVTGPITPLLAQLLDGARPPGSEPAVAQLRRMRLVD